MLVKYEPWVIQDKEQEVWGVKITEGEFDGLSLSFNEFDMENDTPDLALDYTVIQVPEGRTKENIQGDAFDKVLKGIVIDILEKAIEYNENRNGDSTESGQ
jgi:hypothetical protein